MILHIYSFVHEQKATQVTISCVAEKIYVLYDGEYKVKNSSNITIKYMNNGYYDKIMEISNINVNTSLTY